MWKICLMLVSALFFQGCASIGTRNHRIIETREDVAVYPTMYPGIQNFMYVWRSTHGGPGVLPFMIVDFPLEIVVDTVCLPYDAIRTWMEPSQKAKRNDD